MKNTKKLISMLLVLMLVFAMSSAAFAADTFTIQLAANDDSGSTTGHEYTVYQIFTGELTDVTKDGKTETILSNIRYGTAGAYPDVAVGDLVADEVIAAITDAEAFAKSLAGKTLTAYGKLNADNAWTLENVPAGYYMIVDDTTKKIDEGDAFSAYIVQVVNNVTMAPKSEKTSSDKKEYNDAVTEDILNEAGVGTVVSYHLTAHIADDANIYEYYNFVLCDTLSKGLTFNNDITVTIGGNTAVAGTDYNLYTGDSGYTFEISLIDAKAHAGQNVEVIYSATMNANAVAMVPETNTFTVKYSNNPEKHYDKEEDKPVPGSPLSKIDEVLGKTPDKQTKTYDTKLVLTKQDENKNLLANATFRLTSADANQTVLNTKSYFELDPNGNYYQLKNGTYTTEAPTGTTYVNVGKGDSKTTAGYILKDGAYVVPTDTKEYIDADLYMLQLGTDSQYVSTNKYSLKTATSDASVAAPVDMLFTTGANGVIIFDGIATGNYTLTEVDAPDGFNYIDPVTFTITFNTETEKFEISNVKGADITNNAGTFSTTIVDKSGSVLPSTGGIGTTLFYVFGSILVVGAGILLVTKRRMNADR